MKEYDVMITETLQRLVTVEADSRAEAEEMVSDAWNAEKYVLGAEDFVGADFKAKAARSIERPPKPHEPEHYRGQ